MDKCLGRYAVASALRAIGCQVEIHEDHFDHDAEDTEWLPDVGKRGWVILTKDKEITRNYIELCALLKSGAPSFVLKAQDMTGPQMAEAFCKALPQVRGCIKKLNAPFVATISKSCSVRILLTASMLIDRVSKP